jgi:hypothetical protein
VSKGEGEGKEAERRGRSERKEAYDKWIVKHIAGNKNEPFQSNTL